MSTENRIVALRRSMEALGVEAFLVTKLKNIRYLSGFTGSSALAVVTGREAVLATDFRYRIQAAGEVRNFGTVELAGLSDKQLKPFLEGFGFRSLGFESSCSAAFARRLRRLVRPGKVKMADNVVEKIRMIKDAGEIAVVERMTAAACRGFASFLEWLVPGVTEKEAALELEFRLRREGSDEPPFPIIVASGENAAMPHARASDRPIREGDGVLVDFGSSGEGYATDLTRTFCLGRPPDDLAKIYRVVYDAQTAAIDAVRPGARASDVDEAARAVIRAAGMGDCFGHATGHGVGLDVHEAPGLSPENREKLLPGMLVTVEPGIYLAGKGGVRIEDMVLVTGEGRRVISDRVPKPSELGPGPL